MIFSPAARIPILLATAIAAILLVLAFDPPAPAALLLGLAVGGGWLMLSSTSPPAAEPENAPPPPAPQGETSSARIGELLDALPEPMLLIAAGRVATSNRAARALLGGWIEGEDIRLALRQPAALALLSRPQLPGAPAEQAEIVGMGVPDRPWMMGAVTLSDGGRLVYFEDRSEAIAAEKMRVDFVANASHELRTPLATILGFIETLQDDQAATDRNRRLRFLGIMQAEAKRMQQLIEDLLSLSRIEADRYRPPADSVELLPLVEEVKDGCAQMAAERRSSLVIENAIDGARVPGDRGQLLQLIRNLVVNALKYGREGEPVTVRLGEGEERMVRIEVIDRGEGIAPEHLPRLTERFYRVDTGRSRAAGGTGLGLAIVKHIVGRHRGRLDIRSRVGEGTIVEVQLPRAPQDLS